MIAIETQLLDEVLRLLRDSDWHNIYEIAQRLLLSQEKVKDISNFLMDLGFVIFDQNANRVRITPLSLEFLELPQ